MKLKYYGHSCFSITYSDGTVLVTDPFDEHITYPPCNAQCNAALVSHHHMDHCYTDSLQGAFTVIDAAGEYCVGNTVIRSIPSFHDHHSGTHRGNNLLFRAEGDGISIAHLGDLGHIPNEEQLGFLKGLDVLLIPVGGNYTIDHNEAEQIARIVKARVTVAMHYRTEANPNFRADGHEPFTSAVGAVHLPRCIDITPENIASIPPFVYMDYE